MDCIWAKLSAPTPLPFTSGALWYYKCLFGISYAFFCLHSFLKINFWRLAVAASRILPRVSTLLYLIILSLFEERGFFQVLLCTPFFSLLVVTSVSSKDDALEKKSSKNWNFEKNLVQNVHPGWQWYILAFLPHNNVLFLNFFACRTETFVFFSLSYLLYKSIIRNWFNEFLAELQFHCIAKANIAIV